MYTYIYIHIENRQHEDGNGEAANDGLAPGAHSVNGGEAEGGRRRRGNCSGFPSDVGSGNTGSGDSCEFRVALTQKGRCGICTRY